MLSTIFETIWKSLQTLPDPFLSIILLEQDCEPIILELKKNLLSHYIFTYPTRADHYIQSHGYWGNLKSFGMRTVRTTTITHHF